MLLLGRLLHVGAELVLHIAVTILLLLLEGLHVLLHLQLLELSWRHAVHAVLRMMLLLLLLLLSESLLLSLGVLERQRRLLLLLRERSR